MIFPLELSKLYESYYSEYEEAFGKFLRKGMYIDGEYVDRFEKEMANYLGNAYVVGCGNGTDALEISLRCYEIGLEDEVITVGNTYYATARAIVNCGATPVFCDVDKNALIDVNMIEKCVTTKTKAIMPVHLYGLAANVDVIKNIAQKYDLKIIEDCSHAFGTRVKGKLIGSDSECACFSLYPTKNIGAFGDAGFVSTNSKEVAEKIRSRRYYTCDKSRECFQENSMHSRMDSLQAALLLVSLKHIDEWNDQRKRNLSYYIKKFSDNNIPFIEGMKETGIVPYVFPIIVDNQKDFLEYLANNNILGQIHYKPLLNTIPHLGMHQCVELPQTEYFNNHVVSIPISPTVNMDEIKYIADVVCTYFSR